MTDDSTPTGMMTMPSDPVPEVRRSVTAGLVFLAGLLILAGAVVAQHFIPVRELRAMPRREGAGSGWVNLLNDIDLEIRQVGPRVGPSILGVTLCVAGAAFLSSRRRGLRAAAALLLAAPVVVLVYRGAHKDLSAPRTPGPSVPVSAPTVPWATRAETAMRSVLADPKQRHELAVAILEITHPSGTEPRLMADSTVVSHVTGEMLEVLFDVRWKGGILGTEYQTIVKWECMPERGLTSGHVRVTVPADNAPIGQDAESLAKLDAYFRNFSRRFAASIAAQRP